MHSTFTSSSPSIADALAVEGGEKGGEEPEPAPSLSFVTAATSAFASSSFFASISDSEGVCFEIHQAQSETDFQHVSTLLDEFDVQYQHLAQPLVVDNTAEGLYAYYASAHAAIFLAFVDGKLAGCCAVQPLIESIHQQACELHRLFVRPAFRGMGVGRQLCDAAIECASVAQYHCVLLDTLNNREATRNFYEELGFYEVPPFHNYAVEADGHFLKLDLELF